MDSTDYEKRGRPRRKNDELLKGIFEENFPDFLRFIYSNADAIFDFDRRITFMDKELLAIIPERERKGGSRVADLLVKVYLLDGSERWILINTEIEGGSDVHFSFRVYQYHYRILDHLQAPVETIVFFIGDRNQVRPSEYKYEGIMGTSTHFRYLSYHIFDHEESELLVMDNIFAYIVNLNSTILWSLRNKINRLGKAPLCGLIGISQAEATQHSVFIRLAFVFYHFETAIFFLKTPSNSPLFLRCFQSNLTISKRSEQKIIIEFRL